MASLHFCNPNSDSPCSLTSYECLSKAILSIQELDEHYKQLNFDTLVLLVGQKGAGKTTLLNYYISNDANFIIENPQLDIRTKWFDTTIQKQNSIVDPVHLF